MVRELLWSTRLIGVKNHGKEEYPLGRGAKCQQCAAAASAAAAAG